MEMPDVALAALGELVLAFALFSELLRRTVVSEAIVALLLGVLLGPCGARRARGARDAAPAERRGGGGGAGAGAGSLLLLPMFVLLGVALPWDEWIELGWRGPALALAVLLLRRLPAAALLLRVGARVRWGEALFPGWFGPIGISALLYARLALDETLVAEVWPLATLVIVASILAYGATAAPATRLFRARRETEG